MYKKYSPEDLINISKNKEELRLEIENSNGHILQQMKKENIFPEINFLLDNPSEKSLFFIKEYSLNKEQKEKISFFYVGNDKVATSTIALTEDEIKNYLKNEMVLPENTILSKFIIDEYEKEIKTQFNLDGYNIETILKNSVDKLSTKDFLNINENFLSENVYLFNSKYKLMIDNEVKDKFIEIYFKNNDLKNIEIRDFRRYNFETDKDKEVLIKIISNSIDIYEPDYLNLTGANKLVNIFDYYDNFSGILRSFSSNEIKNNLDKIQNKLINRNTYNMLSNYADDLSKDLIKLIFTEDVFLKKRNNDNYFRNRIVSNTDTQESRYNVLYIKQVMLKSINNNSSLLQTISFDEVLDLFKDIEQQKSFVSEELNVLDIKDELLNKVIVANSNTDNIIKLKSNKYNPFGIYKYIKDEDININILYILFREYNNIYQRDLLEIKKVIDQKIKGLDKKYVEMLAEHYNYQLPLSYLINKNKSSNKDNNFLNYEGIEIDNLNVDLLYSLLEINKDFRDYILNNNIVLENIEPILFSNGGKLKNFTEQYIKNNESRIKENIDYIKILISDNNYINTIDLTSFYNQYKQEDMYEKLLYLIEQKDLINTNSNYNDEYKLSNLEKENLKKAIDKKELSLFLNSNKNLDIKSYYILDECKNIMNEISNLITNEDKEKIMLKLFKENNFKLIYELNYNVHWSLDNFKKNIKKVSIEKLNNFCDNKYFNEILMNFVSTSKKEIQFSYKNKSESYQLCEALSKINKNTLEVDKNHEKNEIKFLRFLDITKDEFDKSYLIKNYPQQVIYNYELNDFKYTNEEIIEVYKNVEKNSDIFIGTDVNSRFQDFIRNQYSEYSSSNNDKQQEYKDKYLKMLLLTKDNYPKLYTSLISYDVFRELGRNKDNNETIDVSAMKFYIENFDFDKVLNGISEHLFKIKSNEKLFENNHYKPDRVISSVLWNSYYRSYVDSSIYSIMPDETSRKIISYFIDNMSIMIYGYDTIGKLNISNEIMDNFESYKDIDNIIDKLLLPDMKITPEGFALSGRYEKYVENITEGMINYYITEKKVDELNYINFLIEQEKYNSELHYTYRKTNHIIEYIIEKMPLVADMVKKSISNIELKNSMNNIFESKINNVKKQKI